MADRAILVTGGSGQVGTALRTALRGFEVVAPGRDALDLGDPASIRRAMAERDWAAVVSAGAYTAVDRAESEVAAAWAANALGPAVLAAEARRLDVPIVHLSTDYVFDGTKPAPYREDDPVAPIGVYGASKEGGEQAVRTAHPRHVILRTAWVVSATGHNFVKTMRRLGAERDELRVVADQHGCPTSAEDIAGAVATIVGRMVADPAAPTGTFHFVNAGEATWHDLAAHVLAARGTRIVPIATSDYPTPARRPANSRLDTRAMAAAFGIVARPWRAAIDDILRQLDDAA